MIDERGPLFVRECRKANWDAIAGVEVADYSSFPVDVIADVTEPSFQTSVWRVDRAGSADVDYLVAALVSRTATIFPNEMTFRFISAWRLDQLELRKQQSVGTSLDDTLNNKGIHWTIQIATVDEAIRFARALVDREAKIYNRKEIMIRFALSLAEGRLQAKRNVSGELLKLLLSEGHLSYTPQPGREVREEGPARLDAAEPALPADAHAPSTVDSGSGAASRAAEISTDSGKT
jgi:hypothetical protein